MIKPNTEYGTPYIDICYDADQIGIIYAINIINMEGHRDKKCHVFPAGEWEFRKDIDASSFWALRSKISGQRLLWSQLKYSHMY